ncbi:DUF4160 domain-containing protein [Pseudomonas gingeri]|uniref:DUF4160 domain-containing protein n=1 Tax=Pseudomonas gingeri TaxID=117681 RepID=A0A7Y8CIK3_9PSED|nr:DUF4160 domain-containing protein [Pseudomonas gingeri]NWA02566.1 DUF4160 domain-containing protein [Pseudomonas gingeri]NWA12261.1 DUF4160 domain-containing protein [Pseudomonas gingeri]NWA57333.1 DUF4160 domain-containing protein [Pseudomonas gingeri]NWA93676.1 DUF4160 domain-containing protein [Pseudomonas gingeri]NWB03148.1 DUF4160 domain-containing protein [Pseudomonas gingeri]
MVTTARFDDIRIVIYSNDHRPCHVHVMTREDEAVFYLGCPEGPPELRENHGFSYKRLKLLSAQLAADLAYQCKQWKEIHGDFD